MLRRSESKKIISADAHNTKNKFEIKKSKMRRVNIQKCIRDLFQNVISLRHEVHNNDAM